MILLKAFFFGLLFVSSTSMGQTTCGPWTENGFHFQSGPATLYGWTKRPFSQSKATVIFVNGGPGDHSHESAFDLPDWNVVFFDQRGIACSRPAVDSEYKDRNFYGSDKTANDIEALRRHLGVETVSVYGVSYGTIPAHLYASRFSRHVQALVLEGTVADSSAMTLIANLERRQLLQNFFDGLPRDLQDRILEISRQPNLSPAWFSQVGRMMFYLDQPEKAFRQFLEAIAHQDEALQALLPGFQFKVPDETTFGFGAMTFRMLSCQEMGMNSSSVSFDYIFENRTLTPVNNNQLRDTVCGPLHFDINDKNDTFLAFQHPLNVPVTYIQGEKDGTTSAAQARLSFETAPRRFSQWIFVKDGGHQPLQGVLQSGFELGERTELRQRLLQLALKGNSAPDKLLQSLSAATKLGWSVEKNLSDL